MKIDVGEVLATRDELLRTKSHLLGSLSDAKMAADSVKKSSALAGQAKKLLKLNMPTINCHLSRYLKKH